jgi:hypothetical protein
MLTPIMKVRWDDFRKTIIKCFTCFLYNFGRRSFSRRLTIPDLVSDANINTLVELSDVQFTEAAIGRHYFEATNNVGDQLEFDR